MTDIDLACAATPRAAHTLPGGTRLHDYVVTDVIGEGGFGIVYLAQDLSLQRRVAIKEYMPSSMTLRAAGSNAVALRSQQHADTFKAGLKSFVNEARLLARFDHPSLVKVYSFWESNGTAYMVMPYYEGPTLRRALVELGEPPGEAQLRAWLWPLLDALSTMHATWCYHRDIAPDNILLTAAGPLLLDFGAARHVIGDMTQDLTVVLKPGYAPIEQYGDGMAQGPWTDLYALASVVYAAITGKPPMSAVERMMDDRLRPLQDMADGRYSAAFLATLDSALAVRPSDRPRSVAAFRRMLDGLEAPPPPAAALPVVLPVAPAVPLPSQPIDASADADPVADLTWAPGSAVDLALPDVAVEPPVSARCEAAVSEVTAAPPDSAPVDSPINAPDAEPVPVRHPAARRLAVAAALTAMVVVGVLASRLDGPFAPAPGLPDAVPAAPAGAQAAAARFVLDDPAAAPTPVQAPDRGVQDAAIAPAVTPEPTRAAPAAAVSVRHRRPNVPQLSAAPPTAEAAAAEPARVDRPAEAAAPIAPRCSETLQKASLEPLTAAESAFLKRDCQ